MSHLGRRIKETREGGNGEITVTFKNDIKVVIWKGDYYHTREGKKFRLYLDGFKYSAQSEGGNLIDFEIDNFVTYDVMLNILNTLSRRR